MSAVEPQISEEACQRLRAYAWAFDGECWCGYNSEGINGENETVDHIVHSLVSDWPTFLSVATTQPDGAA